VDFAARRGTPVQAVADGRVLKAGWSGGYGRFVKISHGGDYGSGYAHLSRIAPGLKRGSRVTKGQVIGYVGSTGLATGAHLHFEMYRGGRHIDPLMTELPRGRALDGTALASLQQDIQRLDQAYAYIAAEQARYEIAQRQPTHVALAQ
jgi:murein DD-endopeptidase MepM/ murein hydrolase activator NlpD